MCYHGGMEWLLLALAGGGGGAYAAERLLSRWAGRRRAAHELEIVRRVAEEDVTVLGDQLRRLGLEVAGRRLDVETRHDYQEALDRYEAAARQASRLRDLDGIRALADTLATGRHALACVRARLAGQEVPERRVPCFFNPQHGSSAHDVEWTSPRSGTRRVPACDQCAARVAARERMVVHALTGRTTTVPHGDTAASLARARRPFALGVAAAGVGLAWSFDPHDGLDGWG